MHAECLGLNYPSDIEFAAVDGFECSICEPDGGRFKKTGLKSSLGLPPINRRKNFFEKDGVLLTEIGRINYIKAFEELEQHIEIPKLQVQLSDSDLKPKKKKRTNGVGGFVARIRSNKPLTVKINCMTNEIAKSEAVDNAEKDAEVESSQLINRYPYYLQEDFFGCTVKAPLRDTIKSPNYRLEKIPFRFKRAMNYTSKITLNPSQPANPSNPLTPNTCRTRTSSFQRFDENFEHFLNEQENMDETELDLLQKIMDGDDSEVEEIINENKKKGAENLDKSFENVPTSKHDANLQDLNPFNPEQATVSDDLELKNNIDQLARVLFINARLPDVFKTHPDVNSREVFITNSWNALTTQEKEAFTSIASEAFPRPPQKQPAPPSPKKPVIQPIVLQPPSTVNNTVYVNQFGQIMKPQQVMIKQENGVNQITPSPKPSVANLPPSPSPESSHRQESPIPSQSPGLCYRPVHVQPVIRNVLPTKMTPQEHWFHQQGLILQQNVSRFYLVLMLDSENDYLGTTSYA